MSTCMAFTFLALQGFGGELAVIQQELVERKRWMTAEEFVENWAVAQIMPGPNVVNMALMVGGRYFGLRGALTAMAGMLTVPLILILLLGLLYSHYASDPQVLGALRGMGAVAAGLIIASGFKLFAALKNNPLGIPVCIAFGFACFFCVALMHWPLAYVLGGLGSLACVQTYRKIKP